MFDSHENAVRTLALIQEIGGPVQHSWKAQLYPNTTSISLAKPSPTLIIRLGRHGTLGDVKRLFREYDGGVECMPIDTFLCKSRKKNFEVQGKFSDSP